MLRFRLMMNARSVLSGLKHQKEKRNMDYFAGLDVSVKETSVCIVASCRDYWPTVAVAVTRAGGRLAPHATLTGTSIRCRRCPMSADNRRS